MTEKKLNGKEILFNRLNSIIEITAIEYNLTYLQIETAILKIFDMLQKDLFGELKPYLKKK